MSSTARLARLEEGSKPNSRSCDGARVVAVHGWPLPAAPPGGGIEAGSQLFPSWMDTHALLDFREAKDHFFGHADESPLGHESRHEFEGLDYYDPNPDLVFRLPVQPGDDSEVRVGTSDGAERTYRRAGTVQFEVSGETTRLTLYSTGHAGFFVPFRDTTSGKGTYGAGRYLDIDPTEDGTITLDFNYAYNPSCAYDEAYSCPLPPAENWLRVPIEAGEKDFVK